MAGKSSKGPSKTLSKAESGQLAKWCQVPRKGPVSLLLGSPEDIGLVLVWRCLELVKTLLTPVMHALRRVDAEACALACLVAGAFACWPWSPVPRLAGHGRWCAGPPLRASLSARRCGGGGRGVHRHAWAYPPAGSACIRSPVIPGHGVRWGCVLDVSHTARAHPQSVS